MVAFADILREAFPDWEGNTPIPLTDINASEATHYAFPAPRLRISDSNGAANASANDGESTAARSDIATSTASEETEPPTESAQAPASDADGSQDDAAATAAECSASIRALKERLEEGGMTVEIETDGQALQATKLGDTYRVRPGEIIDGDGALRSQLEPIVEEFA